MDLLQTFQKLRDALDPLGIEVERSVVRVWRDRAAHGQEPLTAEALHALGLVCTELLAEVTGE